MERVISCRCFKGSFDHILQKEKWSKLSQKGPLDGSYGYPKPIQLCVSVKDFQANSSDHMVKSNISSDKSCADLHGSLTVLKEISDRRLNSIKISFGKEFCTRTRAISYYFSCSFQAYARDIPVITTYQIIFSMFRMNRLLLISTCKSAPSLEILIPVPQGEQQESGLTRMIKAEVLPLVPAFARVFFFPALGS